jgi:hypothetical protein
VEPGDATAQVPGGGATAAVPFLITAPAVAAAGRAVLTVDLELGSERRGQVAETLLEVLSS